MENTNQITVSDLDSLRAIVDLAASRGAFRGAELTQVGVVYDKLTTFLQAVVAQAEANASEAMANGETTSAEEVDTTTDSAQGD